MWQIFTSRQMESFILNPSARYNEKNLDIVCKTKVKRLKDGENIAQLGTLGLKGELVVSSLHFNFASYIQKVKLKKPATERHQLVHSRNSPTKTCSL